jgi:hypothetical protein
MRRLCMTCVSPLIVGTLDSNHKARALGYWLVGGPQVLNELRHAFMMRMNRARCGDPASVIELLQAGALEVGAGAMIDVKVAGLRGLRELEAGCHEHRQLGCEKDCPAEVSFGREPSVLGEDQGFLLH